MTKWTRNKCLLLGVFLLLLGLQLRAIKSVTFSQEASEVLAKYSAKEKEEEGSQRPQSQQFFVTSRQTPPPEPPAAKRKTIEPPKWIGLALISVGAVLVLNSFVMPRPDGQGM